MLIAVVSLALLLLWERPALKAWTFFPGPLAVVLAGLGINTLLGMLGSPLVLGASHLVQLPSFGELAGQFSFPQWAAISNPAARISATTPKPRALRDSRSVSSARPTRSLAAIMSQ